MRILYTSQEKTKLFNTIMLYYTQGCVNMEYLDYYDEDDNYLGFETRSNVHKQGLWHKTVHCWLYTQDGKILFQIRKEEEKLYTTASGHVLKGETINEAFTREIKEEIGLILNKDKAKLVRVVPWKMDFTKKDGSIMKDRAKANVFIYNYQGDYKDFSFDENEVLGIAAVDAKSALDLFNGKINSLSAMIVTSSSIETKDIDTSSFLVINDETPSQKYGDILKAVIDETKK